MTITSLVVTTAISSVLCESLVCLAHAGNSMHYLFPLALLIQALVFTHASGKVLKNVPTERYYDLTGSLTYVIVTCSSLYVNRFKLTFRKLLLTSLVLIWACRLGFFLFSRISHEGGIDSRFTEVKKDVSAFAIFWCLQAVWCFLTSFPVLLVHSLEPRESTTFPTMIDAIGIVFWILGFGMEVVADYQKYVFRMTGSKSFIRTGLWSLSRHPNYFGEITLWLGIFLISTNEFISLRHYLSFISPVFVSFLLTMVSGIPLLEKAADKKWGTDKSYMEYKNTTPVLIPFSLFYRNKKQNLKL